MSLSITVVDATDRTLEDRLRAMGAQVTEQSSSDLQALAHPSSAPPDVVVIDLREQPRIPSVLAAVKRQHPRIGFVVVVAALEPALMLDAMRAGVTECVRDLHFGELEAAVNRLVSERVTTTEGEVFAFVGAKGGVGATMSAVNVATALAGHGSTLLIDLHLAGGDAALYLGAEVQFSVIDALENTHRLDTSYFRGLVARAGSGLDVLGSSDRAIAMPVDAKHVRALLDFAGRHYRYIVLDVPRSDPGMFDALDAATGIAIVVNQDLATLRAARRLVTALRERCGRDKIDVVLSRPDKRSAITLDDLTRAIGSDVAATFPSDYRLAITALNRGQAVVASEPRSALAAAYTDYALQMAGIDHGRREAAQEKATGLLGLLTGRRQAI